MIPRRQLKHDAHTMLLHIDNHNITDPFVNLALEEYGLRNLPPDCNYFLAYINRPAAVIGRHQNIPEEVDLTYARRMGIEVVRRISGGGAVYHDPGCLNFCFIQNFDRAGLSKVKRHLKPVLTILQNMGLAVEMNARNDIILDRCKVSGTAQFSNTRRLMVHGTLLFDTDLGILERVLQPGHRRIDSRALKSTRSRVTNISGHLNQRMDLDRFRKLFVAQLGGLAGGMRTCRLDRRVWEAVHRLAVRRYRSWQWNFAKAPPFKIDFVEHFGPRVLALRLRVRDGMIQEIDARGSSFPSEFSLALETGLTGIRYDRDEIVQRLADLPARWLEPPLTARLLAERLC